MDKQTSAPASPSSPKHDDVPTEHTTPQSNSTPASQGPSSQEQLSSSQLQDQSSSPLDLERHPKGKRKRTAYVTGSQVLKYCLKPNTSRPQSKRQVHPRSRVQCRPETRQGGASRNRKARLAQREGGPGQSPESGIDWKKYQLLTHVLDLVPEPKAERPSQVAAPVPTGDSRPQIWWHADSLLRSGCTVWELSQL